MILRAPNDAKARCRGACETRQVRLIFSKGIVPRSDVTHKKCTCRVLFILRYSLSLGCPPAIYL